MSTTSTTSSSNTPNVSQEQFSWSTIQARLCDSVMAIHSSQTITFDTCSAPAGDASGFVVDAENGLVLSNRHVMCPGPSFHRGVFSNNIEVYLQPCYYDPLHDFAVFRYDPAELGSFKPKPIPISPEKAISGMEFRVVGNSSSEKMSVHAGELSQIDCNPVNKGYGTNDYNIFYIQASSTINAGASGSPVVNIEGHAVAMVKGLKRDSSSSFFVTLERAVYALDYVRRGEIPPRGTLQACFTHVPFSQATRYGISMAGFEERGITTGNSTGVLVVSKILPRGPADKKLRIGDIVIAINATPVTKFPDMSAIVDASVGTNVIFVVFRKGQFIDIAVPVQDFYEIMPSRFLELGGSIFHDVSFHVISHVSMPIFGVYTVVSELDFFSNVLTNNHDIIYSVNGIPTPNLQAFMDVIEHHPRNKPLAVKMKRSDDPQSEIMVLATHPNINTSNKIYTRSYKTGFWSSEPYNGMPQECTNVAPNVSAQSVITNTSGLNNPASISDSSDTSHELNLENVKQSFVRIVVSKLGPADGVISKLNSGNGLVASAKHGIIICSTDLVANPTSIITVTFGGIIKISATLAYSHPLYPISFLKYDTDLLDNNSRKVDLPDLKLHQVANINSEDTGLAIQSPVTVIAQNSSGNQTVTLSAVSSQSIRYPQLCNCCTNTVYHNLEMFGISPLPPIDISCIGAVCNKKGNVAGFYVSIPICSYSKSPNDFGGIDISYISDVMDTLTSDLPYSDCTFGVLDVEFETRTLDEAEAMGVSKEHIDEIYYSKSKTDKCVFAVRKPVQVRGADMESLQIGDVILKVNQRRVTHIRDVASFVKCKDVQLTIVRDMDEIGVTIPLTQLTTSLTREVVYWAGAYYQEPWQRICQKSASVPSRVFTFCSNLAGLVLQEIRDYQYYITEVDGIPIKTMDDFITVIKELKSPETESFNDAVASNKTFSSGVLPGRDVTIRTMRPSGEERFITIRTNDHHMPAWRNYKGDKVTDRWTFEYL